LARLAKENAKFPIAKRTL